MLGLRFLERAPHAQQVIAEPVVRRQQLRLLLRRAHQLFEGVLESGLDSLLPVRQVGGPALILRQPHALVEHDLEVEPVVAELRHEDALHQVGQAVLLQQRRRHLAAGVRPALPTHDVVDPVVEDRDRVLERRGRAPDVSRPRPLARADLVVEGDNLFFVEVLGFHGFPLV